MNAKILIADHEQDASELVGAHLQNAGYRVLKLRDGKEVAEKARRAQPDVIILDLNLPGIDGLELCKTLRQQAATEATPILILTARNSEIDRVLAFEVGANDYITKPFSPREVVLRVGKQLRQTGPRPPEEDVLQFGEVLLDRARHIVTVQNKPIELTATEFKLLSVLVERRGRVQARERLLHDVWGYDKKSYSRTVDTHMRRLRKKLGRAAKYLATVRGFGYRLLER